MKFLSSYKNIVDTRLERFLRDKQKDLRLVNSWGSDAVERLLPFVTAGKTIRGSLVLYSYSLFQKSSSELVVNSAAALELYHSGFLIHDDIMDGDTERRGKPSLHVQYQSDALAMCAGDLCIFLGYQLLPSQVQKYVSEELAVVTIAQMHDVIGVKTQQERLSLYKYKTARYSFSVPLSVGAQLAVAPDETIIQLETLGEALGILYQMRDDELDNAKDMLPSAVQVEYIAHATKTIDELPIEQAHKLELVDLLTFCHNRTI